MLQLGAGIDEMTVPAPELPVPHTLPEGALGEDGAAPTALVTRGDLAEDLDQLAYVHKARKTSEQPLEDGAPGAPSTDDVEDGRPFRGDLVTGRRVRMLDGHQTSPPRNPANDCRHGSQRISAPERDYDRCHPSAVVRRGRQPHPLDIGETTLVEAPETHPDSYARDVVALLWPKPFEVTSTARRGSSGTAGPCGGVVAPARPQKTHASRPFRDTRGLHHAPTSWQPHPAATGPGQPVLGSQEPSPRTPSRPADPGPLRRFAH